MGIGWAYVDCADAGGGQAAGPTGSLQFLTGTNVTSGSAKLLYHTSAVGGYGPSTLILSGNLIVTGTVSASVFQYRDISVIDATGSTEFGDSNDDTHMRTGSLVVTTKGPGNPIQILSASTSTKATHIIGLNVSYEYVPPTTSLIAVYTASAPSYIIGVRSTGSVQIEIPAATTYKSGSILLVKDEVGHINGTDIKLSASGPAITYTIDGATTYTMTGSNPAISLYSNGINWFVF